MQTDFNGTCANQAETLAGQIAGVKELMITVNEVPPTAPPVGTVDEATAEVLANLELALRHLEDASGRLQQASHAYGAQGTAGVTSFIEKEATGEEE